MRLGIHTGFASGRLVLSTLTDSRSRLGRFSSSGRPPKMMVVVPLCPSILGMNSPCLRAAGRSRPSTRARRRRASRVRRQCPSSGFGSRLLIFRFPGLPRAIFSAVGLGRGPRLPMSGSILRWRGRFDLRAAFGTDAGGVASQVVGARPTPTFVVKASSPKQRCAERGPSRPAPG
jgi:hypothetical protein